MRPGLQRPGNGPATAAVEGAVISNRNWSPMAVIDPVTAELRTLRALSSGSVVVRGEPGYEEARLAWNVAAPQHPAVVAVLSRTFFSCTEYV